MKTKVMPSIVIRIEEEELSALMSQVKETVATDITVPQSSLKRKKFGAVDLWKCRKMNRKNGTTIR